MDEIQEILEKYDRAYLYRLFASMSEADELALVFFEDVAEVLDILSRMRNSKRNPNGFSIDDAPILGLLVRTWKLLKLIIWSYREDSAEYAAIAERSLIEVAMTATSPAFGRIDVGGLSALLLQEQVQDPPRRSFRAGVLPAQARTTTLALNQREA